MRNGKSFRLLMLALVFSVCAPGEAKVTKAKISKAKVTSAKASKVKVGKTKVSATAAKSTSADSIRRALASTGRGPSSMKNDPNRAVEVRGQSRTLSMMLVIKNGKEGINFIKIRKDYSPEISATQY